MVQPTGDAGVANPNKPTVMVIGSIGHGKSTTMNRLAGQEGLFRAERRVKWGTQHPTCKELANFNLIDTPGLNDARIPTADWVGRFNQSADAKP